MESTLLLEKSNRNSSSHRILLVEDNDVIRGQLAALLTDEGYAVESHPLGSAALQAMGVGCFDVVLLDLGLPDMDGFSLCRELRAAAPGVGIVIVTARDADIDVVIGLDSGADDYITKPFATTVLLARVRAQLRRRSELPSVEDVTCGTITVAPSTMTVTRRGEPVELRLRETQLLLYLCRNAGRVITRKELFAEIWDVRWESSSKTLDMHIHSLRRKLGADLDITTLRGIGYRLVSE